jgi:hypothetical protein
MFGGGNAEADVMNRARRVSLQDGAAKGCSSYVLLRRAPHHRVGSRIDDDWLFQRGTQWVA